MSGTDRVHRYRRDADGTHPALHTPAYGSTRLRAPRLAPVPLLQTLTETTGPRLGPDRVGPIESDLTRHHPDEPQGQRILVHGRILDDQGRPVPETLVEIWQANAAGRYAHEVDQHPAPLDPNFTGAGRCITDADGAYRFVTVKPGAYPWRNHPNAWRPAHVHFSLLGEAFAQRLVTQMHFPDDPLFSQDPIFNAVTDPRARQRLVSRFDLEASVPEWALAFAFDIVLRGRDETPMETST
jgi:protocatechuate 3,4-dioxygenase, beta subunit